MKRAPIIGTGGTITLLPARVNNKPTLYAVNGQQFAHFAITQEHYEPVRLYRTRAA